MKRLIFTIFLFTVSMFNVFAQSSPVGLWQSIDDSTGKPRAEIRIIENGGILSGHVTRSLKTNANSESSTCSKCSDDRKDKPMIGLEIIRGVKANADKTRWEGGELLDPDNGKSYGLRMQVIENDSKLQVRGYIGPFYRTQVWNRVK